MIRSSVLSPTDNIEIAKQGILLTLSNRYHAGPRLIQHRHDLKEAPHFEKHLQVKRTLPSHDLEMRLTSSYTDPKLFSFKDNGADQSNEYEIKSREYLEVKCTAKDIPGFDYFEDSPPNSPSNPYFVTEQTYRAAIRELEKDGKIRFSVGREIDPILGNYDSYCVITEDGLSEALLMDPVRRIRTQKPVTKLKEEDNGHWL